MVLKFSRRILAAAISILIFASWVWAGHGPCVEIVPGDFSNTLHCVMKSTDPPAADCEGNVTIQVQQKICQGTDESSCTEVPRERLITYTGTPCVYVWWASWPSAGIYSWDGCEQDMTSRVATPGGTGC